MLVRSIITLLLALAIQCKSDAQQFAVSWYPNPGVYIDCESQLTVVVEGISCKQLSVRVQQGKLVSNGDCKFTYTPEKLGDTFFEIFKKGTDKKIGQHYFTVKPRPTPGAQVAGLTSGNITSGRLKAQGGIGAQWFVAGNHWEYARVDSFDVLVLSRDSLVFYTKITGNRFTEELKERFGSLEKNDRVFFLNIFCTSPDKYDGKLQSLEFVIE